MRVNVGLYSLTGRLNYRNGGKIFIGARVARKKWGARNDQATDGEGYLL